MTILGSIDVGWKVATAALLYATPKVLTYLCTQPDSIESRVDQLRHKMAYFQEKARELLGERVWFILTDCIADNAWISYLICLAVFPRSEPFKTLDLSLTVFKEFFVICECAGIVRILIAKGLPFTQNYIATRSII